MQTVSAERRLPSFILAVCIALGLVGNALPAQASAARVTRAEFHSVKTAWQMEGISKAGVHHTFDTSGRLAWRDGHVMKRNYRGWNQRVRIFVRYRLVKGTWLAVRVWRSH